MGGFQEVVVVDAGFASGIPDSMGWAEGVVFPLTVATAACGLFERDFLGLPLPQVEGLEAKDRKTVVVWGASSGVGGHAVQLAKAAGFEVVTTASPRNFEYVGGLGARKVFDYASEGVVGDVVAKVDGGECAGILLAQGSLEACLQVAERSSQDLFVASAVAVPEDKLSEGVRARFIYGITRADAEIRPAVFERFLPEALAQGEYQVAPKPLVVATKGLEGIEEGFERLRAGVSAAKVVVVAE